MAQKRKKSRKNKKRFIPYQEKFHLHFSTVVFVILLAYLVTILVRYSMKDTTGIYEVVAGNNGMTVSYNALIVRDETLYTSSYTGYVNYYLEPGDRLRVGSTVCTMDEHGDFMSQLVTDMGETNSLSSDKLKKFKNMLYSISTSYDVNQYDALYDKKNNLNNSLLGLLTEEAIHSYVSASDEYTFNIVSTPASGIFVSSYDGYEEFDIENFSMTQIAPDNYALNNIISGQKINAGEPLYKIIPSDNFTVLFRMSENDLITYWENETISIYFPSIGKELTGAFSFVFDQEKNRYCRVDFSEYGYLFANTRFTDLQISTQSASGLKIPQSSVTTKDYYLIPQDYTLKGGNANKLGCNLQVYENGEIVSYFTEISVASTYENYYLVDTSYFTDGAIIQKAGSGDKYEVGAKKTLQGVYNLNKGYAVFKIIQILDTLDDGYYIIQEGLSGSVSVYDRIAMNAELIQEGEIIY